MGSLITILKRSAASFGSDRCSTLAAAIAYNTVFAIFPMAFVGIAVLGFIVGSGTASGQIVNAITKTIPLGDSGAQALAKAINATHSAKGWLSLIAIISAAWSASGLFGTIRQALDSVWDVNRPLPFLRAKARDLQLFVVFGGLLLASVSSAGFLQGARKAGGALGPLLHLAAPMFVVLTIATPFVLTLFAFLYLYKTAPHARLSWSDVWVAAAFAAAFFTFGTNLLTFYLVHLGGLNALAGSLGAGILFLVFVYYSSQVILLGAEFSKHRLLIRTGAVPAPDPRSEAPPVPLTQKLKDMVVGLWVIEEPHHEKDLPYEPGRMDPVRNEPTNTREEVLFNVAGGQRQAEREAQAAEGNARPPQGRTSALAHALEWRAGEQPDRRGRAAAGRGSPEQRHEQVPFGFARDLAPGEQVVADRYHGKPPDSNFLWRGIGYFIAFLMTAVVKWRSRRTRQAAKQRQKQGVVNLLSQFRRH